LVSLIHASSWVNMVFCTMFVHFAQASFDTGATVACPGWVQVACGVHAARFGAHSAVQESAKHVAFALCGREFASSVARLHVRVTLYDVLPPTWLVGNEEGVWVDSVFCGCRAVQCNDKD
jgi:hypothetical protein